MVAAVETMAWSGETPWHGLGTRVLPNLSTEEMLKESGLDWRVEKRPIYAKHDGKQIKIQDKSALIRKSDKKVLDIVGEDWHPCQNEDAFAFFNEFVEAGGMEMHTAGSLQGGQRVWVLAKVNHSFELFKNDKVDQFMLFSNPHKYGHSIDIRMTPVRVVCLNTLSFALGKKAERMFRQGHASVFNADEAKQVMGLAREKMIAYEEAAKLLATRRWNHDSLMDYFASVFPKTESKNSRGLRKMNEYSRNATRALQVMDSQPGAEFGAGSWWQAFNAITFLADHQLGRGDDTRMTSSWYGPNANRKETALKLALKAAEKSPLLKAA